MRAWPAGVCFRMSMGLSFELSASTSPRANGWMTPTNALEASSNGRIARPAIDWTLLRIWLNDRAVKAEVEDAASSTSTDASMEDAPSAVARTSADKDSPRRYDISFATFSTVMSIAVARDSEEKFA